MPDDAAEFYRAELLNRLYRYGMARNRYVDREPRLITITDDEALVILAELAHIDYPVPPTDYERGV